MTITASRCRYCGCAGRAITDTTRSAEQPVDEECLAVRRLRGIERAGRRIVDVADHGVPISLIGDLSAAIEGLRAALKPAEAKRGESR